ncbi:unnamed protein product [Closterium sp. NIES-65]|nr:unnamed protein product [Closterium sp. NIES-65]
MHDDAAFTAFLSHEFDRLDADGNGALSLGELKPALLRLGELLGMPPAGTAREVDELVEGLFASFMSPDLTEEIGRDSFVRVCKDILSGASHALEEDPLSTLVYDGGALRRILGSAEEAEALISALFAELDTDGSGCISKSELRPALVRLGLHGGDSTTAEAREHQEQVLERIIDRYCLDGDGELCRDEFSALLLDVFKDLSSELEAAPLYLPQRATVLNGAYIKKILNDDEFFTAVSDSMFEEWDVSHKGYLVCTDAIAGFRKLGLAYGLPPPDAAEADKVYTSLFLSADVNLDGFVDKGEFRTLLRSLFIGMQLQLEETPLVLESSVEPKGESRSDGTESVFDGPKLLALLREEGGGQRVRRFLEEKFQEMDKDGRGRVPREAVRAVVAHVEQTSALPSPRRTSFQAPQKRAEQTSGLPSPRRTFSAGSPGVGGRRGERESQALLESARRRGNIAPAGIAAGNAAGDAGSGDWESAEQEVACEEFVDAMMRVLQRMGDAVHGACGFKGMDDPIPWQHFLADFPRHPFPCASFSATPPPLPPIPRTPDDPILQFMADGAKMQQLMEEEGELADDPVLQFMADGAKMQRLMEEEGELATLIDILFSSLDTDGSGTISSCELKPALSTMVQNMGLHTLCQWLHVVVARELKPTLSTMVQSMGLHTLFHECIAASLVDLLLSASHPTPHHRASPLLSLYRSFSLYWAGSASTERVVAQLVMTHGKGRSASTESVVAQLVMTHGKGRLDLSRDQFTAFMRVRAAVWRGGEEGWGLHVGGLVWGRLGPLDLSRDQFTSFMRVHAAVWRGVGLHLFPPSSIALPLPHSLHPLLDPPPSHPLQATGGKTGSQTGSQASQAGHDATVSDLAGRLAAKPEEEEEGQVLDGSKLRQVRCGGKWLGGGGHNTHCSAPHPHNIPPLPSPFPPSPLFLPPSQPSPFPPSPSPLSPPLHPQIPGHRWLFQKICEETFTAWALSRKHHLLPTHHPFHSPLPSPPTSPPLRSSGTGGSSRRSGRTPSPPGTCPGSAASPPLPTPSQSTPFPPSPALPSHLSPHQILGDRRLFQKICEDTFTSWDVSRKRCLSRADISAGLARSGMMWGLPPHNARNAEEVYDRFFLKADLDRSGSVERAEFNVFLRGVFRSMAEELEKNPLVVHTSKVRPPNAGSL